MGRLTNIRIGIWGRTSDTPMASSLAVFEAAGKIGLIAEATAGQSRKRSKKTAFYTILRKIRLFFKV
ncbi:MAG: hypothetical protein ACE5HS_12500, partial [bacterium]